MATNKNKPAVAEAAAPVVVKPVATRHGYVEALVDAALTRLVNRAPVNIETIAKTVGDDIAAHCGADVRGTIGDGKLKADIRYALFARSDSGAVAGSKQLTAYNPRSLRSDAAATARAIDAAGGKPVKPLTAKQLAAAAKRAAKA